MTNARSIEPRQTIDDLLARYKGNVPAFNAMRFLAASAVLVAHSILTAEGDQVAAPLRYLDHLGVLGLYIFFFVSGFVITQSCLRSTPRSYLIRRAARIMPGLILVTLFCALLLGPLMTSWSVNDYVTSSLFFRFFLNILFVLEGQLPGVFEHNIAGDHVNISLWTLRYEILCYVVILAVIAAGKLSAKLVAVVAVGLSILAHPACTDIAAQQLRHARSVLGVDVSYQLREGVGIVSFFFAGSLYYVLRARIIINVAGFAISAAMMAITLAFGLVFPLLPFTLGYAILYLGFRDGRFCRPFQMNDYSYGMYIFAFPVQQSLAALSRNGMAWWMNLGLAFPIVLALAALSWHLIERPSMRSARRLAGEMGQAIIPGPGISSGAGRPGLGQRPCREIHERQPGSCGRICAELTVARGNAMVHRGATKGATHLLVLTIALVCLSPVTPPARAEIGIDSGATFYSNCWSYWAGQDEDSFGDAHKTGFCKGYVKAVTNALLFRSREPVVCLPEEHVSMDEIHQTIRRYFESHANSLHEDIDGLIEMALSAAYPCGGMR